MEGEDEEHVNEHTAREGVMKRSTRIEAAQFSSVNPVEGDLS